MLYTINKTILLENSSEFSMMMRQQNISGSNASPQDIHRLSLMQDGKDVYSDAEHAANKITNDAMQIDNLREKHDAINRQTKGLRY